MNQSSDDDYFIPGGMREMAGRRAREEGCGGNGAKEDERDEERDCRGGGGERVVRERDREGERRREEAREGG